MNAARAARPTGRASGFDAARVAQWPPRRARARSGCKMDEFREEPRQSSARGPTARPNSGPARTYFLSRESRLSSQFSRKHFLAANCAAADKISIREREQTCKSRAALSLEEPRARVLRNLARPTNTLIAQSDRGSSRLAAENSPSFGAALAFVLAVVCGAQFAQTYRDRVASAARRTLWRGRAPRNLESPKRPREQRELAAASHALPISS